MLSLDEPNREDWRIRVPSAISKRLSRFQREQGVWGGMTSVALLLAVCTLLAGCTAKKSRGPTLDRGTIAVEITETVDGEPSEFNIAQLLITRALLLHGYRLAPKKKARFVVEGTLACTYYRNVTMTLGGVEQHMQHQWHALFDCTLVDRGEGKGAEARFEKYSFPEPLLDGRIEAKLAKRDIRRKAATIMAKNLTGGELLGNPEIPPLLDALQDPYEPRSFNEIEAEIVLHGLAAVPFLLEALTDTRAVRPQGAYPGLEDFNRGELKVYHIADHALSVILRRDAALDLLSTNSRRLNVITGWTWAWEDTIGIPREYGEKADQRKTSVPDVKY